MSSKSVIRLTAAWIVLLACVPAFAAADESPVVATVGDRSLTVTYYEEMIGLFESGDLPRGEDGGPVDTATLEGRKAFLQILVNKELMHMAALDRGLANAPGVVRTFDAISSHESVNLMTAELIEAKAEDVTEADVTDHYEKSRLLRTFQFVICDDREDAEAAHRAALDGEDWAGLADRLSDGSKGPNDDYTVTMQYGRVEDEFEPVMFGLEMDQVCEPLWTTYGWWVLKLIRIEDAGAPELDEDHRARVVQAVVAKRTNRNRLDFLADSRERHGFVMDDEAMRLVYERLPEAEDLLDPETRQPVPREELTPLELPADKLDMQFFAMRPDSEGEVETVTLGEFQDLYNRMSVFQRPRKHMLLGGVRNKIVSDQVDKVLLPFEAKERGYWEHPDVVAEAEKRAEQTMITLLHDEIVKIDDFLSPMDMNAFWDEHAQEYTKPESRSGRVVYCADEGAAAAARAAAEAGAPWGEIISEYEITDENRNRFGLVEVVDGRKHPLHDVMFALAEAGDYSEPFPVEGGVGLVRLDGVDPKRGSTLAEARDMVEERMLNARRNDALNTALEEWSARYGVTVDDEALSTARSWAEVTGQ